MLSTEFWKRYFYTYDVLNELAPYCELLDNIIKSLKLQKNDHVLDAGSGTGNLAMKLKQHGVHVTGIDFSPEGVKIHRQKDPEAEVSVGDLTKPLSFPDESFDKICSNNTLYVLPLSEREKAVSEFYRVLKPGGVIVMANIKKGFRPLRIYLAHFHMETSRIGVVATLWKALTFIVPTIKMFYYNFLIKRDTKGQESPLFSEGEQARLLRQAGFQEVEEHDGQYAGQAILVKGRK